MSRKAHGPKHHIVPTSIGGPRRNPENIYLGWQGRIHYLYHQAFVNRPPSVVIKIIEGFTDENGNWNKMLMSPDDYKNMKKIFMGKEPANAIDFIKREFLPVEKKWLRGELPEIDNIGDKAHQKRRNKKRT